LNYIRQPWQLLFMMLAGWVNREQQETIEYPRTENQALKEKLGKKRILVMSRRVKGGAAIVQSDNLRLRSVGNRRSRRSLSVPRLVPIIP